MNMITESEELILNLLWRDEKLSVMQIVKALEAQKKLVKADHYILFKENGKEGNRCVYHAGTHKVLLCGDQERGSHQDRNKRVDGQIFWRQYGRNGLIHGEGDRDYQRGYPRIAGTPAGLKAGGQ